MSPSDSGLIRDGVATDFFGNQRFELEECLGEGASGVVYAAIDRLHDTRVALKVMRRLGPDALFYFKREFRALADIQHPNLVRYHELFEEHGRWFLTMELVRGPSIVEYVRAGHDPHGAQLRCDVHRLRTALLQLVDALEAVHRRGKVHRDVKPSNVRVTDGERVVLLDFGLVLDERSGESSRLAQVGTAAYMAPEQVHGTEVGPLSDYYAVGCILYECLSGRHPFVGEPFHMLAEKQRRDPARPSTLAPEVPPDLDELCMALLSRDLGQRKGGADVLREMLPATRDTKLSLRRQSNEPPEFVGRRREMAALLRTFEGLDEAAPRLAYIYGDSGIGKSAVLVELMRRVAQLRPDTWMLHARCHEREAVPFKAFDGVIDQLARELRRLPDRHLEALLPSDAGLLPQVFPVLGRVSQIAARAPRDLPRGDAVLLRQRVFDALTHLLHRLAEERPVLILIDDVHWADADSLALLDHLLAVREPLAVMFVLTGRVRLLKDDPAFGHLERLIDRAPQALRLRLPALSEADAESLSSALLGEREAAPELSRVIARESAGHPLFVYALVEYALRHPGSDVPTLDEALHASLDELSYGARAILTLLSVAGAPLGWDALARASQLEAQSIPIAVAELVDAKWVHSRQGERGISLEVAHERVRQLLLSRMKDEARLELHGRLGEALSRTGGDPESVALHWVESRQTERVPAFAHRAAEAAVEALAFERAIRLYELALAHVPTDDAALIATLKRSLASALSLSGRSADAAELYLQLAKAASGDEALELRQRAASEWLDARDLERGVAEATSLLSDLGMQLPATRAALDRSIMFRRVVTKFLPMRGEVTPPNNLDVRERIKVDMLFALATTFSYVDQVRATDLQLRHLQVALALGDAYRMSRAFALEAWFIAGALRGQDVLNGRELSRARELARACEHPHALGLADLVEGVATYFVGRFREAMRLGEAAEKRLREQSRGARWEIANAQLLVTLCYFDTGQWKRTFERVPKLIEEHETRGDKSVAQVLRTRLSHWEYLLADDADGASKAVDALRDRVDAARWDAYAFNVLQAQTELDLYLGDPNAHARLQRVWSEIEDHRLFRIRTLRPRAHAMRARAALASAYLLPHQRPVLTAVAQREVDALARDRSCNSRVLARLIRAAIAEITSERERALALYGEAVLEAEEHDLLHLAAAGRRRQGFLLGGEEGRAMIVRAERWLREQGAVDPGRTCAVLIGF